MTQKIIILDFGSQTTQLIGRRVRELDTFCEIMPYNKFPNDDPSVIGVILSGSPYSVHDPEAFKVDLSQFVGKVPVLGICYGAQFISHTLGGKVDHCYPGRLRGDRFNEGCEERCVCLDPTARLGRAVPSRGVPYVAG